MAKKKFNKQKITVKKYAEPDNVFKKNDMIKMNVNIPKVGMGYKINISNIKMDTRKILVYLSLYFDMMVGATSSLNEELINKGIINCDLEMTDIKVSDFICFYIFSETNKTKTLTKMIDNAIKSKEINKKDFDRKKKMLIADLIKSSDNIYSMNTRIMSNIIMYDKVFTRQYEFINKLSYNEFRKVVDKVCFDNSLTYVISKN